MTSTIAMDDVFGTLESITEIFYEDREEIKDIKFSTTKLRMRSLTPDTTYIINDGYVEAEYFVSENVARRITLPKGTVLTLLSTKLAGIINSNLGIFDHMSVGCKLIYIHSGHDLKEQFMVISKDSVQNMTAHFNTLRGMIDRNGKIFKRKNISSRFRNVFNPMDLLLTTLECEDCNRPQGDVKYYFAMDSKGEITVDAKVLDLSNGRWANRDIVTFKPDFNRTYNIKDFTSFEGDDELNFKHTKKSNFAKFKDAEKDWQYRPDFFKALFQTVPNSVLQRAPIHPEPLAVYLRFVLGRNTFNSLYELYKDGDLSTYTIERVLPSGGVPTISTLIRKLR